MCSKFIFMYARNKYFTGSTHSIPVSTDDKKSISKYINSIDPASIDLNASRTAPHTDP